MLTFLTADDARLLSQVQGRTYAYIFGLVERFISAKMLDQGRAHALDDQNALEALVRFTTRRDQAPGTVPPHGTDDRRADDAGLSPDGQSQ